MDKKKLVPKTMYRVEKFNPLKCPKCGQKFKNEGKDWTPLLVVGQDYPAVICRKCNNHTMILKVESYQTFNLKVAQNLLKQGFVNLKKVEAFGVAKDIHIKYI